MVKSTSHISHILWRAVEPLVAAEIELSSNKIKGCASLNVFGHLQIALTLSCNKQLGVEAVR